MKTCLTPALILLLATAPVLQSAVPPRINYQGRVTDSAGAAIGSGTPVNRRVLFRIWNHATNTAQANLIWTEEQTVTIFNGEFSVLLGQNSANGVLEAIFADTSPDRFLEITVDNGDNDLNSNDQAITPRQQMTTVGFAMRARMAESVASGQDLIFSGGSNAGLGWYGTGRNFNATAVDGPVLYGNAGGALGALNGGIASTALRWNNSGNVGIGGPALGAGATKLVLQADDSSEPPQQLRINGATNTNKRLVLGFNTTSNYGALQAYTNNTNTAPLLLNPAGGNVGIGTGTTLPRALISLGASAANSKLLLYDDGTSAYGLGIGGNQFRLHTNSEADRFTFLATPNGSELMTILGNGRVGIGTTAPAAGVRLDVNGTIKATTFSGSGASLTNLPAANLTGTIAEAQLPNTLVRLSTNNTFTGTSNTFTNAVNISGAADTNKLTLTGDDSLGGVSAVPQQLIIRGSTNTNERLQIGFSTTDGSEAGTIMAVSTTTVAGSNNTTITTHSYKPLLLNHHGGNVGIGTATTNRAKLEVNGSHNGLAISGNHAYFAGGSSWATGAGFPAGAVNASIYATHEIIGAAYRSFSDERIKVVAGVSDSAKDLATLLQIAITDYRHVDSVQNGERSLKKVIAQQVEKVFPEVVSKAVGVVPDIFKMAVHQEGWVVLRTDLKVGERVRLLDDQNHEAIEEVLEVAEGKFRTAFKPAKDQIFVYGREVKDFRTVDYEAISMLNVSATQELARRLEAKSAEVEALEERVQELEARDKELAARDQARDAKLVAMEKLLLSLEQPAAKSVSVNKSAAAAQ